MVILDAISSMAMHDKVNDLLCNEIHLCNLIPLESMNEMSFTDDWVKENWAMGIWELIKLMWCLTYYENFLFTSSSFS